MSSHYYVASLLGDIKALNIWHHFFTQLSKQQRHILSNKRSSKRQQLLVTGLDKIFKEEIFGQNFQKLQSQRWFSQAIWQTSFQMDSLRMRVLSSSPRALKVKLILFMRHCLIESLGKKIWHFCIWSPLSNLHLSYQAF